MRGPSSRPTLSPAGIPGLAFALSPPACPEQRPFHTRVPMSRAFSDSEASGLRGQGLCRVSHKQPRPWLAWENEGPGPGTRREGPVGWGRPGISRAFGGLCGEPGRSRRARPAAQGSVTPWAWGGGGAGKAAAGWESGLVSCLEGKGPAEGSGGSSRQAHPCLSPSLFSLLLEKRGNCEPGWGWEVGLDGAPKLEEVALGVGPHLPLCPTPRAHFPKSSLPSLFFLKLSQNSSRKAPAS